jgi:metal-responsive CopG/Arc/MetJ family transcriptional regulator
MFFSADRKVKIDKHLYERLGEAAERAGYASTDELILHVLEREVGHLQDEMDQQDAERQLRGLGYIE